VETVEKQFFPFPSGERMEFDSGEKRGIDFENCCELLFFKHLCGKGTVECG
jgi:hypothetical protein